MADNGLDLELRLGWHLPPVERADNGLDLELRLGLPLSAVEFVVPAPPVPAPAPLVEYVAPMAPPDDYVAPMAPLVEYVGPMAPLDWPQTLSWPSRPNAELLITWFLNMYLRGLYHLVPANLRNEIIELNADNFFALNHNEMINEFYFCQDNVPLPPAPWIKSEGPRKVFADDNLIGRFATYCLRGRQVRLTRYTSTLQQQGQNVALFRIRARDEN